MSVLSELIFGLLMILNNLIMVYIWVIIIAALLSWVRPDPYNPIVQLLDHLDQPITGQIAQLVSIENEKIKIDTQYYDETTKEVGIKLRVTTLTGGSIHIEKIFSVHDQPGLPGMPVRLIKGHNCESSGGGVGFELS